MKTIFAIVIAIILLGAAVLRYQHRSAAPVTKFRTAAVQRGDLVATISASGTVEPEEVVDVGAQVAGQIDSFGKDPKHPDKTIDYGTEVDEGTILARIDDTLYAADTANAAAQLDSAKANVEQSQANIGVLDSKVFQTEADWKRYQELGVPVVAQTDYDAAKANYQAAVAQRKMGDAAIAQAKAAVAVAQAALDKATKNQSYCTIVSPVKGVIIDRRVDIGQTVVSSLNTPSLFLIAKDLKRIQVWASVNEADIGNIHTGQAATFTVDAFPGTVFHGVVNKLRLNATMTQNVVTYTVEITTDNSDGKLLPYLTANVQFETSRRTDVLMVPNSALRWLPQPAQVEPEYRNQIVANPIVAGKSGHVWLSQADGLLKPADVKIGLTDGVFTEIQTDAIQPGQSIIVGEEENAAEETTNPFMPKFGGKK